MIIVLIVILILAEAVKIYSVEKKTDEKFGKQSRSFIGFMFDEHPLISGVAAFFVIALIFYVLSGGA